VSIKSHKWVIAGQGLAGTCLAWELWKNDIPFTVIDPDMGGSSRIAAGMVNPITGKNFQPSWRIDEFMPFARSFYDEVENFTGSKFWYDFPVLRLASSQAEWDKIVSKLNEPLVAPWITGQVHAPDGWVGAVEVHGGGRLDTRLFLDVSRAFFTELGVFEIGVAAKDVPGTIWCDGAVGLMSERYGPHRCAKGEILTVNAPSWDESRIRIGAGGWLVPVGASNFKVGATYEWNELNQIPTEKGRIRVEEIACRLGGEDFQMITHDAGIRPILRRSEPLIGPLGNNEWMFNALGSKGSLYAPGIATRLANWLVYDVAAEPTVNFREFLKQR
jgi:glycine oxidase